jgi:predicted RNase H-like HicB family nuclease
MHVEELPSVKEVVSTLEEARQRVSDADLVGSLPATGSVASSVG